MTNSISRRGFVKKAGATGVFVGGAMIISGASAVPLDLSLPPDPAHIFKQKRDGEYCRRAAMITTI